MLPYGTAHAWAVPGKVLAPMPSRRFILVGLVLGALAGSAAGIGLFTFVYARGYSYLTDDPAACANCHVMRENYQGWAHSSHHGVAVCNDCHTPHNLFGKYAVKAINGYRHSEAFTLGGFHEPIRITPYDEAVTENACRRCHADVVQMIDYHPGLPDTEANRLSCIRCHRSVGHLE